MEGTNAFIVNSNERSVAFNDFASWYQQQEAEYNAQLESFKNDENNTGREFNDFYYFFFNKFLINVLSIEQLKCFVSSWKFEILDTSNYSTSELVIFSRNFTAALLLLKVFQVLSQLWPCPTSGSPRTTSSTLTTSHATTTSGERSTRCSRLPMVTRSLKKLPCLSA